MCKDFYAISLFIQNTENNTSNSIYFFRMAAIKVRQCTYPFLCNVKTCAVVRRKWVQLKIWIIIISNYIQPTILEELRKPYTSRMHVLILYVPRNDGALGLSTGHDGRAGNLCVECMW